MGLRESLTALGDVRARKPWVVPAIAIGTALIGTTALVWSARASASRPRPSRQQIYTAESLSAQGYSQSMAARILMFQDDIATYSEKFGLDPALTSAVIRCESGFRANAISPAGAVGLMQIMPATKTGWASELGIDGDSKDPAFNIHLGTYGLSKLLARWKNDLPKTLASYNWGIGNVIKYPDGPYPKATQDYIVCVTSHRSRFTKAFR